MQYSIIIVNAVNNEVPHDALQYSILWMQWTMKYHMVHCSTLYCECSEQWSTTWCTAVEYVNAAWTVKYHMMDCSTLYCECSLSSEVPHDALQYCILWLQSEQWSTIRYNAVLCDCSLNNEAPQNTMQHAMNALQYSVTAVWTMKHYRIPCSTLWMHCSTLWLQSEQLSTAEYNAARYECTAVRFPCRVTGTASRTTEEWNTALTQFIDLQPSCFVITQPFCRRTCRVSLGVLEMALPVSFVTV